LGQLWTKTALNVVVHSQVSLDHICEVTHDFVGIFIQETLQLAHLLVVVEILLVLSVKLDKNRLEVLQRLNELVSASLLRQIGRLLQLAVLLAQSFVELRQFTVNIVLNQSLLISDDLKNLIFEFFFALHLKLFKFIKH